MAIRALTALCAAALALHELRYAVWLGAESPPPGSHGFDGRLTLLAPSLAVLTTILFASLLLSSACAPAGASAARIRLRHLWPIATGALLAVYAGNELLHGALDSSHPFGLHGLFGHGGWIVVPLALLLGGIVAMAVGLIRELERRCPWAATSSFVWLPAARLVTSRPATLVRAAPLAENLSGRSPPSLAF